ncbi:hypothetical protein EV126DRAFT_430761 [Verticillium dahliae]|nr:hypothetical protein EV126DRAFT_430761 [Verticillium dahliae]
MVRHPLNAFFFIFLLLPFPTLPYFQLPLNSDISRHCALLCLVLHLARYHGSCTLELMEMFRGDMIPLRPRGGTSDRGPGQRSTTPRQQGS